MRRFLGLCAPSAVISGRMALATAPAATATTNCTGSISNTTINGSMNVPAGKVCTLTNVTVTGALSAQPTSTLSFGGGNHIKGAVSLYRLAGSGCNPQEVFDSSITVDGGTFVMCDGWKIGGSLTITNLTNSSFFGNPKDISIGGAFAYQNNADKAGSASGWTIAGSATINSNGGGALDFSNATIGGSLSCSGNTGGAITGTEVEAGSTGGPYHNGLFGQCAGLDPT